MPFLGSLPAFTASMALALLLAIGGFAEILTASGSAVLGLLLILAALGLSAYARKARAGHRYQQKLTGLSEWAQGLGPRGRRWP